MTMHRNVALSVIAVLVSAIPAFGQTSGQRSSTANSQNSASATASKAVQKATADVNKAQADLARIHTRVRAQVLAKPEWASVVNAQKQAQAAADAAKRVVVTAVHNKDDYKKLAKEREDAQAAMSQANGSSNSGADAETQKAADTFMKASFAIKQLESAALKDDSKYDEASKELEAANLKLKELDAQVDSAAKDDKEYQTSEQQLETAKTALDAAKKQLATARQNEETQREQQMKSRQGQGGRRP